MPTHSQRARRALAHLTERDPAIAALALWCDHRDSNGPTVSDGSSVRYGPEFEELELPEQIGVAAHHVLHVAFRHAPRSSAMAIRLGPAFDTDLFALVCDALLNEALLAAGHALPRPIVKASRLVDRALGPRHGADNILADWDAERLYMAIVSQDGASGSRQAARDYASASGFRPDLAAAEGDGSDPVAEMWRRRIERALEAGRDAGLGIGRRESVLADLPAAKIAWEQELRRLVHRATSGWPRITYARPSNRWIAAEDDARRRNLTAPAFEPAHRRQVLRARIAILLDTSSSIDDTSLTLLAAEISGISRRLDAEIRLLAFDTEVHADLTPKPGALKAELAGLQLRRGGGTSFAPAIELAAGYSPSVIMVLTDLEGELGPDPRLPTIWVLPSPPRHQPQYGRVVITSA